MLEIVSWLFALFREEITQIPVSGCDNIVASLNSWVIEMRDSSPDNAQTSVILCVPTRLIKLIIILTPKCYFHLDPT